MSFVCLRCGNCCRQPGYVYIEEEEIEPIARALHMSPARFKRECLVEEEPGVWRLDDPYDEPCRFLDGTDCSINEVKPKQCRSFPTGWRRKETARLCKAYRLAQAEAPKRHARK